MQSGRPRYLCRDCRKKFQDKRRQIRSSVAFMHWDSYVWGKQTVEQLAKELRVSVPAMRAKLDAYNIPQTLPYQELLPASTTLAIDAYFRSRGDGTLIFRSPELRRNLLWYDIRYETVEEYLRGIRLMQEAGWVFTGFVVDGRKGVVKALSSLAPVQYCQFHQKKTIRNYLTKHPKTDAARELKDIVDLLTLTDEASFRAWLGVWHHTWDTFLKEKMIHPDGSTSYTHRRLRAAYRSLKTNLPNLFTCHTVDNLPNTTNTLDGSISHLRTMHRVHRGIKLRRRRKVTDTLLRGKYPKKFQ